MQRSRLNAREMEGRIVQSNTYKQQQTKIYTDITKTGQQKLSIYYYLSISDNFWPSG